MPLSTNGNTLTVDLTDPADIQQAMAKLSEVMLAHVQQAASTIVTCQDFKDFAITRGFNVQTAQSCWDGLNLHYTKLSPRKRLLVAHLEDALNNPLATIAMPLVGRLGLHFIDKYVEATTYHNGN